jgi:hypothetical protein
MIESILAIGAVLLILNVIGLHGFYVFKAKGRLESEIAKLPDDMESVVQMRNDALKAVRKSGKKISFELAASTLKLSELLADEKEDLWNVVSPQRFDITKTWYRGFQTWNLAIAGQGVGARITGIAFILFAVTTLWGIVGAVVWALMASQFEAHIGAILKERGAVRGAA